MGGAGAWFRFGTDVLTSADPKITENTARSLRIGSGDWSPLLCQQVHHHEGRTQIPVVLLLVMSSRGPKHIHCAWGTGQKFPRIRTSAAGRTEIAPEPCGCGGRLVPSTGVRTRPPHLSIAGFRGTHRRLVSACVAAGCCQHCRQSRGVSRRFLSATGC
jgi:hypothetical protein